MPRSRRRDDLIPRNLVMSLAALASLAVAAGLAGYLVYALIRPERF